MAWQEAIIGTELSGRRLIEVRANVGDRVEKGETLAQFDAQTSKAQEAELLALLAQAKATEEQAESDRVRAARLRAAKAMSEQETDTTATRERVAKAQTAAAQARLDAVRLQIAQALVVAPTAGVVSSRTATLGAVGAPGAELFRIIVDDRLEWRGALTARQLRSVAPGQEVLLTLPDGGRANGRVRQISPALDSLRMAIVYADVDAAGLARAGMYADGAIMLADAPAVVVPAASVVSRDGRGYVFKLTDGDDKVVRLRSSPAGAGTTR
jgi:RND family efflux transporter MFP subunit